MNAPTLRLSFILWSAFLGMVGVAHAGTFTSNAPSGAAGATVTYTVSFTGDGATDDAQVDASYSPAEISAITANAALVSGSTCVVLPGNAIRVVPPSGGGTPLTSTPTAYCSFQATIAPSVVGPASLAFTPSFTECTQLGSPQTCVANLSPIAVPGVTANPEFNFNPAVANPLVFTGAVSANLDQILTVENIGDSASVLTLVESGVAPLAAPFSVVSGLPNSSPGVAQGASANLVIRCTSATSGTFTDTLVLTTNDPDDGEGTVNVPLSCTVSALTPEFGFTPPVANPLTFSGTAGSGINRTLTVGNTGDPGTFLTLTAAPLTAPFSIIAGLPNASPGIAQGATANIVVRCNSATAGTFTQTLTLVTNDPDDGEGTVDVPLSCTVTLLPTPEFAFNPPVANPLAFSGTPSAVIDRTITVQNLGEASTVLTLAESASDALAPPFLIVSGLPNNTPGLPGGATANIVLRCQSATAGTFTDTLVLTTNDPDDGEGTVSVPLSCAVATLSAPEIEAIFNGTTVASGASVTLTAPPLGTVAQTLSFGNSGTAPLTVGAATGLSGVLSIGAASATSVGFPVAPGAAGASNRVISCTPGATLSTTQTLSVVNGDADETPFVLQITCVATPAAVATLTPAFLAISGPPQVSASGTARVTNTGTIPLAVQGCAVPDGFTLVTPSAFPVTIAPSAMAPFTLSCTTPPSGAVDLTGSLVCQSNALANDGAITLPLRCSSAMTVIPTTGSWGLVLMGLLVGGLGLVQVGRHRSA